MALRPYGGQPQQGQQMQPMDPFSQMDAMMDQMMMPFGAMPGMGRRGGGMPGMGGPGGMFGQMDAMMNEMMSGGMGGPGGMGGMGGMHQQMMSMSSGGGGQGGFSCQTMMMSSNMGPDGKMHTERFSSSTIGDRERQLAEIQQAYSNSSTGIDKMSLERQMQDQGRKMVKENNRRTGEERNTELFRGITEAESGQFDSRWQQQARPYLPQHASNMGRLMAPQQGAPAAIAQTPASYAYGSRQQPAVQNMPHYR